MFGKTNKSYWPIIAIGAFCLSAFSFSAEGISIEAKLSSSEIYLGDSVFYTISIKGVENPPEPELKDLYKNFKVVSQGHNSLNSAYTLIVNGRKIKDNRTKGRAYSYLLTPKIAGRIHLPEPKVIINGTEYKGRARIVNIITPQAQDTVLLKIILDKEKMYPSQINDVTFRIMVEALPNEIRRNPVHLLDQPPKLNIPWIIMKEGLRPYKKYDSWLEPFIPRRRFFEKPRGFALENERNNVVLDFPAKTTKKRGSDGKLRQYYIFEVSRKFFAEKVGTYTFGPLSIKGNFITGVSSNGRYVHTANIFAVSKTRILKVVDAPSPRPNDWCGSYGPYKVSASAAPTDLKVGDPLTLTLTFEKLPGAASVDWVSPPDLTKIKEITDNFVIIDSKPIGEKEEGLDYIKHFRYDLRPKHIHSNLPPLTISTFEAELRKYVRYTVLPPSIRVEESDSIKAGDIVSNISQDALGTEMRAKTDGIYQAAVGIHLIGNEKFEEWKFFAYPGTLLFLYLIILFWISRNRKLAGDEGLRRKKDAVRTMQQRLAAAESIWKEKGAVAAAQELRGALLGLIADTMNLPAGGLTAKEANSVLETAGVEEPIRQDLNSLLEELDGIAYSGTASNTGENSPTAQAKKLGQVLYKKLG